MRIWVFHAVEMTGHEHLVVLNVCHLSYMHNVSGSKDLYDQLGWLLVEDGLKLELKLMT